MKYFSILLLFLTVASSHAWDRIGHYVIGELASKYISNKTTKKISKLLGGDSLAHAAIWADFIRSDKKYDHFKTWHYLNIPKGKTDYLKSIKSSKGDIIRAILHCNDVLRNKKKSFNEKSIALKLLIHLVGDIHQPLHVGYDHDRGGNRTDLAWFKIPTNLHILWDRYLIEFQKMSYTEYANHINRFASGELQKIRQSSLIAWCYESRSYLPQIYEMELGPYWEYEYNYKNIKILNNQLKKAGIRLAYMLEQIFSNRPESQKMLELKRVLSSEGLPPLGIF